MSTLARRFQGRQTQFHIELLYGLLFIAGFAFLAFRVDPRVAAFEGGLVVGYLLRIWEKMSIYERILETAVSREAEQQVADEVEQQVEEELSEEVEQQVEEELSEEVEQQVEEELSDEVEQQVEEELSEEVDERLESEVEQQVEAEMEELNEEIDERVAESIEEREATQ